MKAVIFIVWCLVLAPVACCAGEKTLFAVAENTITLAEAAMSCAAQEGSCTDADALALRGDAKNGLRDILQVVVSGNLKLSSDQARYLLARVAPLRAQAAQSGIFQTTCNLGHYLFYNAEYQILIALLAVGYGSQEARLQLLAGLAMIPIACLVLLTCMFWWL